MEMTAIAWIIGAFLAGAFAGVFFVATLWGAVRAAVHSERTGLLLVASFLARMVVAVGAFYLSVRQGGLPGLVAATLGFLVARTMLIRGRGRHRWPWREGT